MFCNLAHFEIFAKTVEVGLKSALVDTKFRFGSGLIDRQNGNKI